MSERSYPSIVTTDAERAEWDAMQDSLAANREHNVRAMDEAEVPRVARRGFTKATAWHHERIVSIERRESHICGRPYVRWIVVAGESTFRRSGWIVGPRGRADRAY